jgi:cystathionine gamma-synthase/methionine-gamma-lyase
VPQSRHPSTLAVHAGDHRPEAGGYPTTAPISLATAWAYRTTQGLDDAFDDPENGYVYARFANPTTAAFESAVAALEGTDEAVAFASGMAAIHGAIIDAARPGQKILASQDVYGATYAILNGEVRDSGIEPVLTDITDLATVTRLATEHRPAAIMAETISNPLLRVADIPALSRIARSIDAALIIDNTFASPIVVRPHAIGADYVVHSTTKYIGGHGDSTGGVIATTAGRAATVRARQRLMGPVMNPFDAWLTHRGLKTLAVRMRAHCENAAIVRDWLAQRRDIDRVHFPGAFDPLPDGVFHTDATGAMLAFEIAGAGRADIFRFLESLTLIVPAPTLGDVASLALYPAMSSQRGLTPEQRAEIGIGDNLVRLSVGIEDPHDIIADLERALDTVASRRDHR